jgi:hypothetical protein
VDELQARWRQGEERLYAAALGRADVYELSLELVSRTTEHLRGLGPGPGPLLAAADRGADLVVAALGGAAPAGPVDLELVAQAALALRQREVAAEQAAGRRVHRMREARGRGDDWAVLEESGDAQGSPLLPYRRLEAQVSTGRAVLVTTSPDASLAASLHAVEGLLVDVVTGALRELGHSRGSATLHADAVDRERRAAALRQELSDP